VTGAAPFIFIVAGEPSGDALGAALLKALRQRVGNGCASPAWAASACARKD